MIAVGIMGALLGMVVLAVAVGISWFVGYATGIMQTTKKEG